jgi:hypothetical protein
MYRYKITKNNDDNKHIPVADLLIEPISENELNVVFNVDVDVE